MWFVSWESTPARVKASKRGAKFYPREEYSQFTCLKYYVLYKNKHNLIQWTSGCTGLLQWYSRGFDTYMCRKALFR
jgi:hypothetical protein